MKVNRVVILCGILAILLIALFYSTFERKAVADVNWTVDYSYESQAPHGSWLFYKTLEEVYGQDRMIKLDKENYIPKSEEDIRKGYIFISSYATFELAKVNDLFSFVSEGNDAVLILADHGYYLDTLLEPYYNYYSLEDSIVTLSKVQDTTTYELSYYYSTFDSTVLTYHYAIDSIDKNDSIDIEVLSYMNDTIPVFIKLPYGAGQFYIHTLPDAFSNIGMKQGGMNDYVLDVMPKLDIDTLYLDHDRYNANYGTGQSPLQFVMSQPPLRWAYYLIAFGLILFVVSRGRRRQRVIPTLVPNENTSLEYIETLSELYRSQYQHHKLAKHLKVVFHQWIKKKYFISANDPQYVVKIAQKSKVSEGEIERIIHRLNRALDNRRFDDRQLTNLYEDLDQFYNKCK